jgi:hypothetical protein
MQQASVFEIIKIKNDFSNFPFFFKFSLWLLKPNRLQKSQNAQPLMKRDEINVGHYMEDMSCFDLIKRMKTSDVRASAVADEVHRAVEADIQCVKDALIDEHMEHLKASGEVFDAKHDLKKANESIASKDQIITTLSHKLELAKVQLKNYEKMHDSLRFILKHSE